MGEKSVVEDSVVKKVRVVESSSVNGDLTVVGEKSVVEDAVVTVVLLSTWYMTINRAVRALDNAREILTIKLKLFSASITKTSSALWTTMY